MHAWADKTLSLYVYTAISMLRTHFIYITERALRSVWPDSSRKKSPKKVFLAAKEQTNQAARPK